MGVVNDEAPRSNIPVTARTPQDGPPTAAGTDGSDPEHRVTVFEAVGGQAFFDQLVERFYALVADDDVLLALYPEQQDLGPARERLALFLGQYWGGPQTYSERRGHPRLRMRHVPFAIGTAERDHWLAAMSEALEATMPQTPLDDDLQAELHLRMSEYFEMAATHLVNQEN
ncbi:MAG: globin [Actinomycetia bacterium]|nr:globin [Actinomycetes bacterium]